ncbi:hypothetical protein GCM10023258_33110 [Terrabacter aeriphilus]|uniref:Uncharacterized protein n=1 Tax=Terrabacter aeriphilus TaxID=515662 RepID=A0ABP9JJ72_9MICO
MESKSHAWHGLQNFEQTPQTVASTTKALTTKAAYLAELLANNGYPNTGEF